MSGMKRPDKIRVGAMLYKISYSKTDMNAISITRNTHLLGNANHHDLQITIDDTINEQVIRDTLMHETIHALWISGGLEELDGMTQEQIVNCLTPRFVAVLRANPGLVEYLVWPEDADDDQA